MRVEEEYKREVQRLLDEKAKLEEEQLQQKSKSNRQEKYMQQAPEVSNWLTKLGMLEYLEAFVTNGYDTLEVTRNFHPLTG